MDRSEWVLVPRMPTEAMAGAFWDHAELGREGWVDLPRAYTAMLAAAPPPPAEQASGEWQATIDRIVPAMEPVPDNDDLRCCEWALWKDRERIRRELAALSQRPVVDDDMLIRAENAYFDALPVTGGHVADRPALRAALTAALAPQQPTGEEE